MNRQRKEPQEDTTLIRVWTHEQAQGVAPYIASVMRSLRNHRLEAQARDREASRLAAQPGRPSRAAMIAREEALEASRRELALFEEAMRELIALDIFCVDPLNGEAVIPFIHDEQLAWYIYDHFQANPLQFWRYNTDSMEIRRPIAQVLEQEAVATVAI